MDSLGTAAPRSERTGGVSETGRIGLRFCHVSRIGHEAPTDGAVRSVRNRMGPRGSAAEGSFLNPQTHLHSPEAGGF